MDRSPLHHFRLAGLGLLLGLAASWLRGQAGAPFLTDDPGTPGDGHWEFNLVSTHEQRDGTHATAFPVFDVAYGLGERCQLNLVVTRLRRHDAGGPAASSLANSLFGVKWRFSDDQPSGLSVAISPQLEFRNPGSDAVARGLAADENTFVLPLELQREVGGWCLNAEIGVVRPSKSESGWRYGIVIGHALGERVESGLELHGEASRGFARTALAVNAGGRFKLTENLNLLAAVGRELHNHLGARATLLTYVAVQWTR
ncbi:MAG: hypothetical protein JSR48_10545 [Verrucomicrobia bacterium]|nr:hypothetical protein [Verrucomicrobiota bacterium]